MKYPRFEESKSREQSFRYSNHLMYAEKLSKSGFFFIGGRDAVQCYYCGLIVYSWNITDNPDVEHLRHSPTCQHIKDKTKDSITLSTDLMFVMLEEIQNLKEKMNNIKDVLQKQVCKERVDEVDRFSAETVKSDDGYKLFVY